MNAMSQVTEQMVTELSAGLAASYTGLMVQRGLFRPASLPTFTRYAIIITPSARPVEERRNSIAEIQYVLRLDIYALVKNWEETDDPLFGTTTGEFGLFELVEDIKDLLRLSNLNGLLDKTYDEPGGDSSKEGPGPVEFEEIIQGFDSGEHAFTHRARIPYLARTIGFCHPRFVGGSLV